MAEINFVWTLGLEIVFRLLSQHHVTSDKSVLIRIEEKIDRLKLKLENRKKKFLQLHFSVKSHNIAAVNF